MENIKIFKQLTSEDVAIAGGKGASLGEMTSIKIPVPSGFVVLTTAFEKFIKDTDINIEIDAMWNRLKIFNTEEVEKNSELIQNLIINKDFPEELGKEILMEFSKLKAKHVAVRSSATSEDSELDAWAGQLDSYLYVDKKEILKSIQKCWASLFTPRAIFYCLEKKFRENKIAVAVVVQKMVDSKAAGVCFTVHPVTKDKDQMIIEACWGLGEALVRGLVTPDSYVIKKSTLDIIDVNVVAQEKQIVKAKKETRQALVSKKFRERQKLTEKQIKELAKICINIENHYGDPRDIEWAFNRKQLHILQARPITTLKF